MSNNSPHKSDEGDNTLDEFLDKELEQAENATEDVSTFLADAVTESTTQANHSVEHQPRVYFHSSEDMQEIDDESVELVVTSPPYNADWAYGSHDDNMNYQTEYLPMLAQVFMECHRVLVPGGRLVINLPTLLRGGTDGGQGILADVDTLLNEKVSIWQPTPSVFGGENSERYQSLTSCMMHTDFAHREWITWNKGFNTDGLAPNGSFPRPWGVLLNNMHEGISVYQKPGNRDYDELSESIIESSKIDKWSDDLCDDCWDIHPESYSFTFSDNEEVPVFPEELARRCIALWSYKHDTVLDPFAGRGTTLKIAKDMARYSVGYEIREELEEDIEHYVGLNQQKLF